MNRPARALAEVARKLRDLRTDDRWKRLAIESRRTVVKLQLLAGALGAFLVGRSLDDAARKFRTLGRELKELGGALEERGFGTKVLQLFERLR